MTSLPQKVQPLQTRNPMCNTITFSFIMFTFSEFDMVWLTCGFHVCDVQMCHQAAHRFMQEHGRVPGLHHESDVDSLSSQLRSDHRSSRRSFGLGLGKRKRSTERGMPLTTTWEAMSLMFLLTLRSYSLSVRWALSTAI
jgi:hypothetical protein